MSKTAEVNNKVWTKPFDVNISMVYGMRSIRGNYSNLKKICFLTCQNQWNKINFDKVSYLVRNAAKAVTENSLAVAAAEF